MTYNIRLSNGETKEVENEILYKYLAQISSGFIHEDKLLLEELNSSNN